MRLFKSTLLGGALLLSACQSGPVNDFDVTAMDNLLSEAVTSGAVPGVSAIVYDDGQVVYKNAFGLRDIERDKPVELDTVFRIYSMTKPITSALIMDLVEEGIINLSDPVSKYIPELGQMRVASLDDQGQPVFTPQSSTMTIKDLLLHRAGLGYGIFGPISPIEELYEQAALFNPDEDLSVKMTKLSNLPLLIQPGEGWYYSYAIDVLGRVAEVAAEEKLSDLLKVRIFDPLGMSDTGFYVRPDQKARFASNYARSPEGEFSLQDDGQASPYLTQSAYESGGGGLVSTLDDYGRFSQMLLDGGTYEGTEILKESTVKTMMQNQLDPDDLFLMDWLGSPDNTGFGYGGSVVTTGSAGQAKGQYAWGGLAKTNFHIDPENGAYAVIMLQFFTADEPPVLEVFRALVSEEVKDEP